MTEDNPYDLPDWLVRELTQSLEVLAYYRQELARCKELGRRFGGGDRYVQDTRRNLRRELLSAVRGLREFSARAKDLGYRPAEILREIESGRATSNPA